MEKGIPKKRENAQSVKERILKLWGWDTEKQKKKLYLLSYNIDFGIVSRLNSETQQAWGEPLRSMETLSHYTDDHPSHTLTCLQVNGIS